MWNQIPIAPAKILRQSCVPLHRAVAAPWAVAHCYSAGRHTVLVDLSDGRCRTCGEQLRITGVDDATMDVECQNPECADGYSVEPEFFGDGGIHYWPQAMVELGEGL